MAKDVRYQLLIDQKADADLTAEASEIEVVQTIEGPTTFRIRFATDVCDGDLAAIDDPRLKPGKPDTLVSVLAVVDGETSCLVHGIITRRRGSIVEGGPGSWVEITGSDRRAVMDREFKVADHTGKASEAVEKILKDYEFELDVEQTKIEYSEDKHTLIQRATDLSFVTMLAGQNDFYFWVDFEFAGGLFSPPEVVETAHFKPSPPRPADSPLSFLPPILAPSDAPTLKLNSGDGCSNVFGFEIDSDAEAPNQTGDMKRIDFDSAETIGTQIREPSTEPLGTQKNPAHVRTRRIVTAGTSEEAEVLNQAALNDAAWSVSARAETSVYAFDGLARPHDIIKVTGAGKVADGDYFVKSVTHHLNPADHRLTLELLRNALGGG